MKPDDNHVVAHGKNQKRMVLFWILFAGFLALYAALMTANKNSAWGWLIVLAVFGAIYSLKRFIASLRPWILVIFWVIIAALLLIPFGSTISPSLPSLQARAFRSLMLYEKSQQATLPQDSAAFIKLTRQFIAQTGKGKDIRQGIFVEEISADGVPCEWVYTKNAPGDKAILYIHGGGFVAGSPKISRTMSEGLAFYSGVKVLAIDYRLAPEYPFPAGLDDCVTAYRWLVSQGIPSNGIVIAGDSAGGNLALAAGLALKMKNEGLPAGFIAISPCTDLAVTGESAKTRAKLDPMLSPAMHGRIVDSYLPRGPHREEYAKNPLVSPLYGKFNSFPPVLIEVGTEEILYDDSIRMAERLANDGVKVTLRVWNGLWHVFPYFSFLPESARCFEEMGDFVRTSLGMKAAER